MPLESWPQGPVARSTGAGRTRVRKNFVTTCAGESGCVAYNFGACSEVCEHGSIHVCLSVFLGSHRSTECEVAHEKSRTDAGSLSFKGDLVAFASKPHPAKDHRGRFVTTYDGLAVCHAPGECLKLSNEKKGMQYPQRDSFGRALTSLDGRLLCSAYNVGRSDGVCRNKRAHLCWHCLGRHNSRDCHRYRPKVDSHEGNVGSLMGLRYHPDCSSSKPAAQCVFCCNLDIQCTERVHVLVLKQKHCRWRRMPVVSASQEPDGGAVDSGPCVADPEENLPVPAASAGSVTLQSEGKPGDGSGVTVGGTDMEASSGAIIPVYSKLDDGQIQKIICFGEKSQMMLWTTLSFVATSLGTPCYLRTPC